MDKVTITIERKLLVDLCDATLRAAGASALVAVNKMMLAIAQADELKKGKENAQHKIATNDK